MSSPEWVWEATRGYLAVFYTFVALFYTVRIITLQRSTQQARVFHGTKGSINWWHHKIFGVFRVLIWMICVWRLFVPSLDNWLGLFPVMHLPWLIVMGNLLLTLGFAWAILSHFSLGHAWTSGVDENGQKPLVTQGVYSLSRNPIYLGVLTAQFGFMLALPSVFSVICFIVGVTTIVRQTQVEESHLFEKYTEHYTNYCQVVRRWL